MPEQFTGYVIRYPDGRFQGYPSKTAGRRMHPRVEDFSQARTFTTRKAAAAAVTGVGGVPTPIVIILQEPPQNV